MTSVVHVELGERGYPIAIGRGVLCDLGRWWQEAGLGRRSLVVTDSNVGPLYGEAVRAQLAQAGVSAALATVAAGEGSKTIERWSELLYAAVEAGLDRRSAIVALGGGVIGDLAGFVAATFLRGIRYVQVPTSLLAMVDSSVGGKTGLDLRCGKNLVGAFHQPSLVVADLETLRTLPEREHRAGLAEVIKYGVILDAALFERLEASAARLMDPAWSGLDEVIAACCRLKARVVAADEREGGLRAILNYGHTLGHALEAATGYERLLHGEAVAIGMVYAAELSVRRAGLRREECDRLVRLLRAVGLPVTVAGLGVEWERVEAAMGLDKKAADRVPRFVLAETIGRVRPGVEVPAAELKEAWDALAQ
ncbi:MAG: 3-dehydroquinate synthase [Kiritimatiellae bacterium]|nr:3-dehydroquinate synthase [Kiritimatiellia bacterium]